MDGTVQLILSGAIALLLLYVGLAMKQFSASVTRLETAVNSLFETMGDNRERLASLEALVKSVREGL